MGLLRVIIIGLARVFGVSLVELAADREDAGELAEAAASAADEETLLDVVGDHVDDRSLVESTDLDSVVLTSIAADRLGRGTGETDTALERFAEQLGRDPDDVFWKPIETIEELPDRPQHTYIWILKDGVDAAGFADQIDSMYREHFGRDPRGLHVPLEDVEEIRLADPAELRTYVAPHLSRAEEHEKRAAELVDPASASPSGGD